MLKPPKLPKILDSEKTPLVVRLLEITQHQSEIIQYLKDEISELKGLKKKPKIKPSAIEKSTEQERKQEEASSSKKKRPGSKKRSKSKDLKIDNVEVIKALNVPKNSIFKGYKSYKVQGLKISSYNTEYKIERWELEDGGYLCGELPKEISSHFSPELISFIIYQYYQCHVTQPLLLEQLREFGVQISSGQLDNILNNSNEAFHAEKNDILSTALKLSSYIQVYDTGARHKGKNGYCTHIGNEFFAFFKSLSMSFCLSLASLEALFKE